MSFRRARRAFCSADFIKNGELQRILARRIDVGRENSLWWTLATRGAGQIRALFREVFTRLRVRLGHLKLPARRSTFLQSGFSRNRTEIERSRGRLYARGTRLDPCSRQISPKKTGFYLDCPVVLASLDAQNHASQKGSLKGDNFGRFWSWQSARRRWIQGIADSYFFLRLR